MLITDVLASGLILDGIPLSVEDNEHLLRWPGSLVGHGEGYATHKPQTRYFEATLRQQGYQEIMAPRDGIPLGRVIPPPVDVPDRTGKAWRDRLKDPVGVAVTYPELSPWRPGFARPNAATAMEARQNVMEQIGYGRDIPHPFPDLVDGLTLPDPVVVEDPEGAAWALGLLSLPLLHTALIRADVAGLLGADGAGQALYRYLLADRRADEIRPLVLKIQNEDVDPMCRVVEHKIGAIEREAKAWRAKVRIPVCTIAGDPDTALTLANMATAGIAIQKLGSLRDGLLGFRLAAVSALGAVG
jgi:hypothetical protein